MCYYSMGILPIQFELIYTSWTYITKIRCNHKLDNSLQHECNQNTYLKYKNFSCYFISARDKPPLSNSITTIKAAYNHIQAPTSSVKS